MMWKYFFVDPTNDRAVIGAAASYVEWWGRGGNCQKVIPEHRCPLGTSWGPGSKLSEAKAVLRHYPPILTTGEGWEVMGVIPGGRRAYYRTVKAEYRTVELSIGGYSTSIETCYLSGCSRYIAGTYAGGALALTEADAECLGVSETAKRVSRDTADVEAVFGANVRASRA